MKLETVVLVAAAAGGTHTSLCFSKLLGIDCKGVMLPGPSYL